MKNFSKLTLGTLVGAGLIFASCSNDDDPVVTPTPVVKASIYDRLGGTTMVPDPDNAGQMIEKGRLSFRTVVNKSVALIVADITAGNPGNLAPHFAPLLAETEAIQNSSVNLTDFFSYNTGGTNEINKYKGLDMVSAHDPAKHGRMGAKASNADYTRFEGFVGKAANEAGVASGTELYTDIVAVLESLRPQIVQK